MKVKEESENAGLKLNIPNLRSWHPSHHSMENRETMETVTEFIFLGSKITADGDYSHEIKRFLLLERKADQLRQHIKKTEILLCQ